jgi:3'(2'), 5'-bisphosphate nucleotidase
MLYIFLDLLHLYSVGMWVLDPIDGTAGFLCGGQYAICLALIVDGKVELGVIGCPNLPVNYFSPDGPRGCLFTAVRGQGAQEVRIQVAYTNSPFNRSHNTRLL